MTILLNPLVDDMENVTSLTVYPTIDAANFSVIYSVYAPNLKPTDVILFKAQFEVTTFLMYELGLGRYLVRTDSPTSTSGVYVKRAVSSTVTQAEHHIVAQMIGVDTGMPAGNYYYNLVAYADSSAANPGDSIVVEQHYGDVTLLVFDQ